ncbi:MAG: alpha/beta fold hydrolase [Polyangiales bacterium]
MTSTRIQLDVATGAADGVIARPSSEKAGVIVIQEWWGIVPHIEDLVRRFAAHGYTALAPDLYHGKKTLDAEEASHLMNGLDWARAAVEITAAVKHLREKEGCTKVGVVGYCMGGALAMIAASVAGVDAYAAYYGFPPKGAADLSKVSAPGLIFFGEHEGFFSVPDARHFADEQSKKGIATELTVYPGAGHAFFNDTRPEAYNASAANDAWRKTLAHFGRYLRG